MGDQFSFDVFLSHSAKDKAVVRALAERLRADGLKVWFDEWVLKPGDSIPAKIEEGLEHSRVLVLCMSASAFGSDWAQLEARTFRFRDPLNKDRRFIPLRLDDAPIRGRLAQYAYIDWRPPLREQEYAKLLASCRSLETRPQPLAALTTKPKKDTMPTTHRVEINRKVKRICFLVIPEFPQGEASLPYLEGNEQGFAIVVEIEDAPAAALVFPWRGESIDIAEPARWSAAHWAERDVPVERREFMRKRRLRE